MKEKQESEASRKKVKQLEERAKRMAAEAEAKSKEVEAMKTQVRDFNHRLLSGSIQLL